MSADPCATSRSLLSLAEAQTHVRAFVTPIAGVECVPLAAATGRVLAQPVKAVVPLPVFDNAAVDGYAVATRALGDRSPPFTLPLLNRVVAGESAPDITPTTGTVRIFTGAAMPAGFDAVVMQEHCRALPDRVIVTVQPTPGLSVRYRGEDVASGDDLLTAGVRLDARHVALAAAVGLPELWVQRRLRAAVFSTGNELRAAGSPLPPATIFDSNRPMVASLLCAACAVVTDLGILPDDPHRLASVVREAGQEHDLIVSTGAVSVGDEDHVGRLIASECRRRERLWMAIKPGKPAMLGEIGNAAWLALPGNAFAAFVAFLVLGRPAVQALTGQRPVAAPFGGPARAAFQWQRKTGRDEFFPVRHVGHDADGLPLVEKLGRGGSARLRPLVEGDGVAMVGAEVARVVPGDRLTYLTFAGALCP